MKGNPVRNYRADVYLTPEDGGTAHHLGSDVRPQIPGTGRALEVVYRRIIGGVARRLVAYAEK